MDYRHTLLQIGQFLFDNYQDLLEGESEWEDEFVVLWDGPGMNRAFLWRCCVRNVSPLWVELAAALCLDPWYAEAAQ